MLESSKSDYILEIRDVTKIFPGVKALDGVQLQVKTGTIHALCGENGAGKSTLMKIINGIYSMDSGEIIYKNKKITPHNPRQMLDEGIATIHQELSPVLEMTIAENIFLGREHKKTLGLLDKRELYREASEMMKQYGLKYNPRALMKSLTIADMQLIEIVKAISRGSSLIIMDEPTSSITESETKLLFGYIRALREKGISVIYISHKMEEIFTLCDEVTVFRDGKWVATNRIADVNKNKVIELMVGREISNVYPKVDVPIGHPIMEIRNFSRGKKFKNIDFNVRKGEIVGFAGLVGAGRTELFKSVFGLDPHDNGEVLLEGNTIYVKNVQDALRHHIVMTPEDRKKEGLVLCRSIKENIALPNLFNLRRLCFINKKKEAAIAEDISKKLAIKKPSLNVACSALSGGNQQKVVLAKWLLHNPNVLILDEPTRGIDVGAKYEIYRLICDLAKQGIAIIMISSELPELIGMCDRIVVMSNGKITGELPRTDFSQEAIMTLAVKGFEND